MKSYLLAEESLAKKEERLRMLRKRYADTRADNVREQIRQFEKEVEKDRADLRKLRSDVYRAEKGEKR